MRRTVYRSVVLSRSRAQGRFKGRWLIEELVPAHTDGEVRT